MTSLLSYSWRRAQASNHRATSSATSNPNNEHSNTFHRDEQAADPWALGIATSTSSVESVLRPTYSEDTTHSSAAMMERVRTTTVQDPSLPSTPEGLRPRKALHKVREELMGYYQQRRFPVPHCVPPASSSKTAMRSGRRDTVSNSLAASTCLPTSFHCEPAELPPVLQCDRQSPQTTLQSSAYMEDAVHNYQEGYYDDYNQEEHDFDIVSMVASPSMSRRSRRSRHIALSPELKPGRAKTAVGAVLAAMEKQGNSLPHSPTCAQKSTSERSEHSILPPREWMDKDFEVEDDIVRDDVHYHSVGRQDRSNYDDDDDNQSSLHASPSSNQWKRGSFTSWKDRQEQFQRDTSFTRNILSRDPNASWQMANSDGYDFDPILPEEEEAASLKDSIDAPRLLSLVNDHGALNVSAISSSHPHHRDFESLHSLADTIDDDDDEDDEEDYNQINRYQPLIDEISSQPPTTKDDGALLQLKVNNQRRIKEQLLLTTLVRLCSDVDLLKEIGSSMQQGACVSPRNNILFGLEASERKRSIREMENIVASMNIRPRSDAGHETKRMAIQFCLLVLQIPLSKPEIPASDCAPRQLWVSLPGLRSALGLDEEPESPTTIRGGDTSLFSLPSESANAKDDTPHTSNVSMTTTITTVLSPERNRPQLQEISKGGLRSTIESLTRLLARLEAACLLLTTLKTKLKTVEEITQIYKEFLQLPASDLKKISQFFELSYMYPPLSLTARTVSEDFETDRNIARLMPPPIMSRHSTKNSDEILFTHGGTLEQEMLRINVVEGVGDEIGQKVECDLWTPTTEDMKTDVVFVNNGPNAFEVMVEEDSNEVEDEGNGQVDDLRRVLGSFDLESVHEEREEAPARDEDDEREEEFLNVGPLTNGGRRTASNYRPTKSRKFWKGRVLGSRRRRFSCAE